MNKKVYVIKPYNKYLLPEQGETILQVFNLYDQKYCIVETICQWGKPIVSRIIEEQDDYGYYIYNTRQQAQSYIRLLKIISR